MMWNPFTRLIQRLAAYPWWQVAIELLVIWAVVYAVLRFVQGTRAAGALKGTLLMLLVATLLIRIAGGGGPESFQRIKFLYDHFVTLLAVTLIVVFQPELRRGLIRLGETSILRRSAAVRRDAVAPIVEACAYLSRARFGGIIAIERETPLKGLVEGGTTINAVVSARLLQSLFFPGSALHDLAVTISGTTITAAGVQLPLAEPEEMPDPSLGSRHRAAVGLSKECDAVVVVVSEETGGISIAERGRLDQHMDVDRLRSELSKRLGRKSVPTQSPPPPPSDSASLGDSTLVGAPSPEPAGAGNRRN
jgi:diadenylate cyclase